MGGRVSRCWGRKEGRAEELIIHFLLLSRLQTCMEMMIIDIDDDDDDDDHDDDEDDGS